MRCETCNVQHNGQYGSGRFCSKSCASSFSTKEKRGEINRKVSNTLKRKITDEAYFERYGFTREECEKRNKRIKRKNGCVITDKEYFQRYGFTREEYENRMRKICPVYGIAIRNRKEYNNLKWAITNPSRMNTIKRLANMFDIELGTCETPLLLDEAVKKLQEDYDNGLSSLDIKEKYCIQKGDMCRFLQTVGVKTRNVRDAVYNAIKQGKDVGKGCDPKYVNGWHEDWAGKRHYYRSSYELNFYCDLDKRRLKYYTETLRIEYFDTQKNRLRIAIPDVLIDTTIYEVKSEYTLDVKNMIDKVTSYEKMGYKFKLVLEGKVYDKDFLFMRSVSINGDATDL